MRIPRRAAVAAMALAALAAGGCGESNDDPRPAPASPAAQEQQTATDTPASGTAETEIPARFGTFRDFLEFESPSGACARISRSFTRRLGGREGCERHLAAILARRRYPLGARTKILRIRVHGDRATVDVRSASGVRHTIPFARDPDGWNIDGGKPWR